MGTESKNPLEVLLVDESQSINLVELAEILRAYINIDKKTHKFHFLPPFGDQKNEDRILLILAASKARKELLGDEEKLSPSTIIELEIMPTGSVKATLKKLSDSKVIRVDGSKYYLPNYQINALAHLKQGKNE